MAKRVQSAMCCPCGREKIIANGLCATCYTLKRQDAEYFGGHREAVLARDEYRCQIPNCTTLKRGKRSVAVHHRVPGNNDPKLMITLCLADHARVTRTQYVQDNWHPFLRKLWREQHPTGHEQTVLNFDVQEAPAQPVPLFVDKEPESGERNPASGARMPHQLTKEQSEVFAQIGSPVERLRYLQGTVGLQESDALRCLSAWIEGAGANVQSKEPETEPLSERTVEYETSHVASYED